MKLTILVGVIVVAVFAISSNAAPSQLFHSEKLIKPSAEHIKSTNIEEGTFNVRLDHSQAQDPRTIEFTYNYNLESYEYGGPVFLYLKDGEDTSTQWIEQGLMVDIARQNNGSLFTFDMRYFGVNRPTEDASFENLRFLTPEQMLHDVAELISVIRRRHAAFYSPVIVWGSGYGATIAAWARKKYPHLVDGVWASSGVYQIDTWSFNKYDSIGYVFYNAMSGDLTCRNNVLEALQSIEELLEQENGAALQEHFNLCHPVDVANEKDMSFFYEALLEFIVDYFNQFHLPGVNNICRDITAIEGNRLESLARWFNYVRNSNECADWSYDSFVASVGNVEWDQPGTQSGRRQWAYLQCTQSALFQITDDYTWMPNRIESPYRVEQCEDVLGEEYQYAHLNQAMESMRNTYGSYNQRITNIIYTNGYLDVLMFHGIYFTNDNSSAVRNIEHVARSADLTSISAGDPFSLNEAKQFIVERISEWANPWNIWQQNGRGPSARRLSENKL